MLKKSNKKSTTKYSGMKKVVNGGRIPVIIPIIALIEVIIIVVVSTYSWYYLRTSKTMSTGMITVSADSGLDIDFKDADDVNYIDIWNYIDDSFAFEPATSTDGRNIYFPTSGTFEDTNTVNMTFRDGTINDINSKYINIDFELTNTNTPVNDPNHPEYDIMDVYLSSRSSFTIKENLLDQKRVNGSALRLALYNNDGKSGKISSTMVNKMSDSGSVETEELDPAQYTTVYFYAPKANYTPYAYIWYHGDANSYKVKWPGTQMTRVTGRLYKYTFKNRTSNNYDRVVFSNTYTGEGDKSNDLIIENGHVYHISDSANSTGSAISLRKIYFICPQSWTKPYIYLAKNSNPSGNENFLYDNDTAYGEVMTEVTPGIYSYILPSGFDFFKICDDSNKTGHTSTFTDLGANDGKLYYISSPTSDSANLTAVNYSSDTIYFYNTHGWESPTAAVSAFPASSGYTYDIPMIPLSGNVFYCKLPSAYISNYYTGAQATNCQVYFKGKKESDENERRTESKQCIANYIYRPTSSTTELNGEHVYTVIPENYSEAAVSGSQSGNYAVISPGVSAGFQRSANPVHDINYETGTVTSVIPTFSSSFDDYIYGSENPLFSISAGQTINMSMIIWLEGTDEHCTGENYAAKLINLYLEFVTAVSLGEDVVDAEKMYDYQFIDRTEQIWCSNTITVPKNAPDGMGVNVSPVMQLYDKTIGRGYLMSPKTTESYENSEHVRIWECRAPASLVTDHDTTGKKKKHDIEFRRVNPYNEDEVWNRWDAGLIYNYQLDAKNGDASSETICFTAFADGSPDDSMYDFDLPERSCGGLWGDIEIEQLVCYDGRSTRDIGNDGNVLTIRYKYTYGYSGQTVDLEYRTSGVWRDYQHDAETGFAQNTSRYGFYGFVVPKDIYARATKCRFNLYSGFNKKYAINSDLNDSIELSRTWFTYNTTENNSNNGKVKGDFFCFNEKNNASPDKDDHTKQSNNYHSYWGSDVIYVQAESGMSIGLDGKELQMEFYVNGVGHQHWTFLNWTADYKGNNNDYGSYVAVIPSEYRYDRYRLEVQSGYQNTWCQTDNFEIGWHEEEKDSSNNTLFYHNSTWNNNEKKNYDILKLGHRCRIFLQNGGYEGDYANNFNVHWWTSNDNGDITMKWKKNLSSDGKTKLFYSDGAIPYGANVKFSWNGTENYGILDAVTDNHTYHLYGFGTYGDGNGKPLVKSEDWDYTSDFGSSTVSGSAYLMWNRYNSLNYWFTNGNSSERRHVPCYTPDGYRDTNTQD